MIPLLKINIRDVKKCTVILHDVFLGKFCRKRIWANQVTFKFYFTSLLFNSKGAHRSPALC